MLLGNNARSSEHAHGFGEYFDLLPFYRTVIDMDHVVVTLHNCGLIGLSMYDACSAVVPASAVLALVKKPIIRGDEWDATYREERWEETLKILEEWGSAMVVVKSFGMVCGEFQVFPYLISEDQFFVLYGAGVD